MNSATRATPSRPVDLVTCPQILADLCDELLDAERIGLDVETTIHESPTRLCTVQLATDGKTWVVDALAIAEVKILKPLFESPSVVKIIHNASFERGVLGGYGISINNVFDTLSVSRRVRGRQPDGHSLGVVCAREFGLRLDKAMQKADWTQRPLTRRHIDYAALDAEVLIDLHERLH